MKEKPILFSGEMVRAILDGRKTQTRRVSGLDRINANPDDYFFAGWVPLDNKFPAVFGKRGNGESDGILVKCPFGQSGDRLWVRETWWFGDLMIKETYGDKVENVVLYKSDGDKNPAVDKWHPSIHMRREYSRINLEVVSVRVERLQDITDNGAYAEGCSADYPVTSTIGNTVTPVQQFRLLWDSINLPRGCGWAENPWVWVIEFRRINE